MGRLLKPILAEYTIITRISIIKTTASEVQRGLCSHRRTSEAPFLKYCSSSLLQCGFVLQKAISFRCFHNMSNENSEESFGAKPSPCHNDNENVAVVTAMEGNGSKESDSKPEVERTNSPQTTTLSKRALKRQARAQKYKELKKRRKAENQALSGKDEAGYSKDEFDETSYYFENGLRKVYPYYYVFATHAKGRWVGRTLKDVLEKEFGFNHPSEVDRAFSEKKLQVNNHLVASDYVVKNCDYISHQTHRHENPVTDAPIEVIEDNDEVIVVNKPASIPCHPCGRYRYNSMVFILGKEMGYSNLRNIYRLDRMTSGVLILGKTADLTKRLEDQVLNRQVQKEYICRVIGEFPSDTVTVDQPLQALSNKLRLQVISPKGKSSQTTFQRLSFNGRTSVVRCIPHTGRTHQIRVHLQYLGHPILNDVFYNSSAWGPNKGKGGVYQVSHDTTCARIYHAHQATQWEGGDNPLFYEKVKEESEKSKAEGNSQEVAPPTLSATTVPSSSPDKSPIDKGPDISSSATIVNEECKSDKEIVGPASNLKNDEHSTSVSSDLTETKEEGRPKFDQSKWTVDQSCELCRKKCIDPQCKDLVMFLHALKYQGPGWQYETSLPDWAQDDWSREDEFTVESSLTNEYENLDSGVRE